jgi:hypothetical protein
MLNVKIAFREVSDTNSILSMTEGGNIMVNETFETDGEKLNNFGETKDGINENRRDLLEGSANMRKAQEKGEAIEENKESMTDAEYKQKYKSAMDQHNEGEKRMGDAISK